MVGKALWGGVVLIYKTNEFIDRVQAGLICAAVSVFSLALPASSCFEQVNVKLDQLAVSIQEFEQQTKSDTIIETKVVNFSSEGYTLTDEERTLAERIVACEAGADTLEGQMAVAQCLFDSVMIDDSDLHKVYDKYGYSLYQRTLTEENKLAVSLVFDYGAKVSDKPIQWFVTVAAAPNSWHENYATFDAQYGAHRFYYDSNIIME